MEKERENVGKEGVLYLCATPIGNLEDITLRVIRILDEVNYIVAEDTRHTIKLLNHLNISKPLISYHKYSGDDKEEEILSLLEEGYDIALVSDAGMPSISDPGENLVKRARDKGIGVTVLPGATAGLSALVLSGFPSQRFVFEGFLPKAKNLRQGLLKQLRDEERTIILYESPHHLLSTLKDLHKHIGNRKIAIVRELTKVYEEALILSIKEGIEHFDSHTPRGEFVLIMEGAEKIQKENEFEDITVTDHILRYMDMGLSKKEALKMVAKDRAMPRNEVYEYGIHIPINKNK